jgi:hypothetical protein
MTAHSIPDPGDTKSSTLQLMPRGALTTSNMIIAEGSKPTLKVRRFGFQP